MQKRNRELPPLNALKSFEAAARLLSFTHAAEELNVTQGAISRQVKSLEAYFGCTLFIRKTRSLSLTPVGYKVLPKLTKILDEISAISQQMRSAESNELRIKVSPTFAIRWLLPRMKHFESHHPDIPLRVTTAWQTSESEEELDLEQYDIILHCGHLPFKSHYAEFIRDEQLVPVCSPSFITPERPLESIDELTHVTLLHPTLNHEDWTHWLTEMKVEGIDAEKGLEFDTLDMAITAAAAGHGVAIADAILIKDEIDAGRLVIPFNKPVKSQFAYAMLVQPDKQGLHKIAHFRQWLLSEVNHVEPEVNHVEKDISER